MPCHLEAKVNLFVVLSQPSIFTRPGDVQPRVASKKLTSSSKKRLVGKLRVK